MIQVIRNKAIKKALKKCGHQYLSGDLEKPQELQYITDKKVNVGMGYHHFFESEEAHYHTTCVEYQYVIKGTAKYFDIDKKEEIEVKKGDYFIIRENTRYTLKAKKGCQIIFFKNPAINDKITLVSDEEEKKAIKNWQSSWKNKWNDVNADTGNTGM